MTPFRLEFRPRCVLPDARLRENMAASAHHPLAQGKSRSNPLAVVGGGPSAALHLDELRDWQGEIWAINYTAQWLRSVGIDATLFSIDPQPFTVKVEAPKALLCSSCDPSSFVGRQVETFHLAELHDDGIPGSATTATRAPALALRLGHKEVHFFGCEGSFFGRDHVDRHDDEGNSLVIRSKGCDFLTYPEFLMQGEHLAGVIRAFPNVFKERSGGLLAALVLDPDDWEVVAVSARFKASLIEQNGDIGLYEGHYSPKGVSHGY